MSGGAVCAGQGSAESVHGGARSGHATVRPSFTAAMASTDMADSRNGASFHDRFVAQHI